MTKRKIIALSLGYQLLIGVFVGVIQTGTLLAGLHSTTINGIGALMNPIFGTPFNTGGFTIRLIFEALVEPLEAIVGHRSATVLSNLPFYLALLLMQMVIVAVIILTRYQRTRKMRDWIIVAAFAFVLINGLMNIMWPWWGT